MNPLDDKTTESVCASLLADNVASNFNANWKAWGKVDINSIQQRTDINETSVYETLERAKVAFVPVSGKVQCFNPVTGKWVEDTNKKAIFNPAYDQHLAIVGSEFNAMSHWDTLKGLTDEILENGFIPTRVIAFDRGARVLMQCIIPSQYHAAGRAHNGFFTVYNGIDGGMKTRGGITLYTPICVNTYQATLQDLKAFSAKHTKNMANKLQSIKSQLFELKAEGEKTIETLDQWGNIHIDRKLADQFINAMIPLTDSKAGLNRQAELTQAINSTSKEIPQDGMSIYDLFAGITRYVGNRQQKRDGFQQLEYVTTGPGGQFSDKAFNWLQNYVDSQ